MQLLPECLHDLRYPAFWEHLEDPSLTSFLDFRLLEGDLGKEEEEHRRYRNELDSILNYHTETTETGKKAKKAIGNFKNERKSKSIRDFWDLQSKRENILAKIISIEDKRKLLAKKQDKLRDQICLEQSRHVLNIAMESQEQDLVQIPKKRLFDESTMSHEESNKNKKTRVQEGDDGSDDGLDYELDDGSDDGFGDELSDVLEEDVATGQDVGQSDEHESPEEATTEKAKKKPKTILSWGHAIDKLRISDRSDNDWLVTGYNISSDFRKFQIKTVDRLKNDPTFSYATDIDEILCLSSIIYVKEDKPKYVKCSDQVWKTALPKPLTPTSLPVSAQLNIMEYSMLLNDKEELDVKWHQNWSKWDPLMTKEERSMFDCVQIVTRNFFLNLPSDNIKNTMDEDTFVHRYCHSMFEEVFNVNNLEFVWANSESSSSKERRKSKHGRKPDFRVLFSKGMEITFGEVKPPSASNNMNQTLIKLAEFMKGSLASLHKKFGYSQASETFGVVVGGSSIRLFSMDIAFDGLYRFKQIGKVLLPTEIANFLNIVPVITNLYSLLKLIDRSIDELNRPSTPTGMSYHRESNSSPCKVPISALEIPPPELSD